jgi:iron(III) transport system substrate-binding protein
MKTMSILKYIIPVLIFFLLIFSGCKDDSNSLVVYTTVDQVFSEPVLKKFESLTGIKIKAVYDTEETKSTGVLNRLLAEKSNPQCDVFWSGDPMRTVVLENEGMLYPYISRSAKGINDEFKDKNHLWTGFSARARVLIYNKNLLKPEDIPQSIFDLVSEKYKGKVAIANPLFGTTTYHLAALFSVVGDERAKEFLKDLKNNKVVIATSNGDVKKRVIKAEVFCGLTDTDDAFEAIKEGENIGIVFLDRKGIGSLIIPNTVSLIKKKKISNNAKILMDFLLSKQTESELSYSCAQMPLHKGVKTAKNVPSLDKIKPMKIDYIATAKKLKGIQNYLKKWVEN